MQVTMKQLVLRKAATCSAYGSVSRTRQPARPLPAASLTLGAQRQIPFLTGVIAVRTPAELCCRTSAAEDVGVLISKTEIPAFIPRDDFMDQLVRWATMESYENALRNFGMPMKIDPTYNEEGQLWGCNLTFLRDGDAVSTLYMGFDNQTLNKYDWVGQGEDGFPVSQGNSTAVEGKNFEIRKICNNKVDEQIRAAIKEFCKALVQTINNYYAFGSVFVDEAH